MTDEHVLDLLPCYVLGILDDTEKMMVSRHLSACADCRKELDSYTETPSHLGITRPTPGSGCGIEGQGAVQGSECRQ